jgi:hypothetical protein
MSIKILDRRNLGRVPYKGDERYAYVKRRKLGSITALGCHHTANGHSPLRGTQQQRIAQAIERAGRTAYHVEIFRDLVIWQYPLDLVTWHGGLLNMPSIGVAVGGRFAAMSDDFDQEIHDNPLDFEEAIAAFFESLTEIRNATGEDALPNLRLIRTHSQTTRKPADPGEGITRLLLAYGALSSQPLIGDSTYQAGRGSLWPESYTVPHTRPAIVDDAVS